jgi:hypothetical protein
VKEVVRRGNICRRREGGTYVVQGEDGIGCRYGGGGAEVVRGYARGQRSMSMREYEGEFEMEEVGGREASWEKRCKIAVYE